jgi:hypothetical protein
MSFYSLFSMPSGLFISSLVGTIITIGALSFSLYTLTSLVLIDKPSIGRGADGPQGERGISGICDNTSVTELYTLFSDLNATSYAFNFCPIDTCDTLTLVINDIESVIDNSNLRGINLIPLVNDIQSSVNITTNGTFCYQQNCVYYESILTGLQDVFSATNSTSLIQSVSETLVELEALVSNDTFAKYPISDASFVNGTLSLYKINGLIANSVVITDSNGILTTTLLLTQSLGGTGANSSGWNGIVHIDDGVWSANTTISYNMINITNSIVNSDVSTTANISRTKISIGDPNEVVITHTDGTLTSEPYLSTSRGGHGTYMGNATGYTLWTTGVVTQVSTIDRIWISAGSANHVVINSGIGVLTSEAQLAVSRGGTGKNFASSTGFTFINSGVWNTTGTTLISYSTANFTNAIVNADVSTIAAIDRTKIAAGTASHVVINDGSGVLSSEALLATTRGGIHKDSSSWTGYPYVQAGDWTYLSDITYSNITLTDSIVNADIATAAAIARTKLAAGSPDHVLINDGSGLMSSEAQLAISRGGTGTDFSSATGFVRIVGGVFTNITQIPYSSLILTGNLVNNDISSAAAIARNKLAAGTANHVIINDASGILSSEARLAVSRGGTNQDSSAWSAIPLVTAGVWSAGLTYIASTTVSPVISFGGASVGITYGTQYGRYTQIGNMIMYEANVVLTSKGSSVGSARISLPIAAATPSTGVTVVALGENIDIPASYYTIHVAPEPGVATALIVFGGDNLGASTATNTQFAATSALRFCLMYSP